MNINTKNYLFSALSSVTDAQIQRLLRRADVQIEFARAFQAALPPKQTESWQESIDQATARLDNIDPDSGLVGLQDAVNAVEEDMAAIGSVAKGYKIHCVGHGHIDMNWMWSWPETVAATHDTFASVLRLMDEYEGFTYSQSQAAVYALAEKYFPQQFAQIQKRVAEGRWEVSAAHWVEGDKNLASGESLCRHLLLTRRWVQDKFGLTPEDQPVDWEPDTFGHAITIPSLVVQGAVKFYYACRTGGSFDHTQGGDARPALFWWQGPDGRRVLVNRETTWYNSHAYGKIGDNIALPLATFVQETGLHDWLNVYGIGNHGGGPTRVALDWYSELREYPIYPQIVWSTARQYFEAIERRLPDALPVLTDELNFEFTGCYTSQSLIKQANRLGENFCEEAETLALLASRLAGYSVPASLLREAWINVLFNQFHDILPGSGVRQTREHALALFQEVGAITGSIKRTALGLLARRINTLSLLPDTPQGRQECADMETGRENPSFEAGAGMGAGQTGLSEPSGGGIRFRPYVVYNPCAWSRSERITVNLYDTVFEASHVVALDTAGVSHPTLVTGQGVPYGHQKTEFVFDAKDVPALGYKTYLLCEGNSIATDSVRPLTRNRFETPSLAARVDRFGGGLLQLTDMRTGAILTLPGQPLVAWASVTERPKGMTAWILGDERDAPLPLKADEYHVSGVHYSLDTGGPVAGGEAGVQCVWNLSVLGTRSVVRMKLDLHTLAPRLDFTADVDWREVGDPGRGIPGLTIRMPLALTNITSRYEVPFGSVERTLFDGEEVPALRYAHLEGQAKTEEGAPVFAGVTLLQDGKSGHSLVATKDGCEMRLRIVRSSFDPDPTPEVAQHTFRFSLVFHDRPVQPSELARLGAAWNHPLIVMPTDLQSGDAPLTQGFVHVQTPGIVLSALKSSEDGNGLVLRLVEMDGQDTQATVEFAPQFAMGLRMVQMLDALERSIAGNVDWDGSTLRVPIKAHSFITVRLADGAQSHEAE